MAHFQPTPLQGAFQVTLPAFSDNRGSFVKIFNEPDFSRQGLDFTLKESYYSFSKKDVIRGMHFQLPPHQHTKIVCCPRGAILDVALDLRRSSPTYGQFYATELSATNHQALLIPEGFAHGFKSLTDDAMTLYLVSSAYEPDADTGILYNSFGMDWTTPQPIVSDRDLLFPAWSDWNSPF